MNLSQLAIQKALNNEWQEAISLNIQIINEEPENIDALNRLGQALIKLQKFCEAKEVLYKIISIDPLNPIARRNLDKIQAIIQNGNRACIDNQPIHSFSFIEEPGKSRVISLIRVAENSTLSILQSCLELEIQVRSKSICFYFQKSYIGRLPDDLSRRLIWLIERNNKYKAYIKSVEKNKVRVFMKEIKCSPKNKNHISFISVEK